MRNIWMLTTANLRKNKGQTFSMLVLMLIVAMLLNIGLVVNFGIGSFFDERAEALHTPHFTAFQFESDHFTAFEFEEGQDRAAIEFLQEYPGVTEVAYENVIVGGGNFFIEDVPNFGTVVLANGSTTEQMAAPALIGDSLPLVGDAIYVPYFMLSEGGYAIGDAFTLEFWGDEHQFMLAGVTEEILFGARVPNSWRVYVSDDVFYQMQHQYPDNLFKMISARMEHGDDAVFLAADFMNEFLETGMIDGILSRTYNAARDNRLNVPRIMAIIMVAFSIILLAVGAIVIRFRIINTIEEGMINIGALKALGFQNYQIISSIVLQFGLIALLGSLIGIVLSQAILPVVADILKPMLGLIWNPAFNIPMMLVALFLVLPVVLLFSALSARRIRKLHPLIALRGGLSTHSFRRNGLPLDKAHGPLALLLGVKQLLQNKKQAVMLILIIGGVTFTAVAGLAAHYNINVNSDAFLDVLAGEAPDLMFFLDDAEDSPAFVENMRRDPEVEAIFGYQNLMLLTDDVSIWMAIVEDTSYLAGQAVVEGRLPRHDNEIALGAPALTVMGKNLGDWITIRSGDYEQEYLVTGIIQAWNFNGLLGMISFDGASRVLPDFVFHAFSVNLTGETDASTFMEAIREREGDIFTSVLSIQEIFDGQLSAMGDIFALVTVVILFVVAAVVILVLYLVLKTTILRRRRDLGIQKALGFSTLQLMNQIALSLSPTILLGVAIGAMGGYFGFNLIFALLAQGAGIVRVDLPSPLVWTILLSVALVLLAYAVSMLIAWRIRKISAYALVSE